MRSPTSGAAPPPSPSRRDRIVIRCCILAITALAWAYLVHLGRESPTSADPAASMAAMGMAMDSPWTAVDFIMTWAMWSVMMIGMMAPSAAPVLLLFAETEARRARRGLPVAVVVFGLGYLALWIGFSAAAALAQGGLHKAALLSSGMAVSNSRIGGAVMIAAGVYQLTPAKGTCLKHCQSPLGFLMSHWREGVGGAFQMGLRHGVYCVGCCWALMVVLFVVGVMNLAWVGILTVFILLERFGRAGMYVARVGGIAITAAGVFFVAGGDVIGR